MKELAIKLLHALSLLIVFMTLIGSSAQAQQENGAAPPVPQARDDAGPSKQLDNHRRTFRSEPSRSFKLLEVLNLTPEQQAQVRIIRQENEAAVRDTVKRRVRAQKALEEAIYAQQEDEAVIQQLSRELADVQVEMVQLRTQVELRIRRLLNTEQLARFRDFRRESRSGVNGGPPQQGRPGDGEHHHHERQ
ncbi:MAG: Spy/CpxP family protein refolding chaperone [Pyrinomonadaceae bacterium]